MREPKPPRRPYNRIVIFGMWMTLAVLLFWAGGEAFKKVETLIPWILAVAVLILILGLLIQFQGKHKNSDEVPKSSS